LPAGSARRAFTREGDEQDVHLDTTSDAPEHRGHDWKRVQSWSLPSATTRGAEDRTKESGRQEDGACDVEALPDPRLIRPEPPPHRARRALTLGDTVVPSHAPRPRRRTRWMAGTTASALLLASAFASTAVGAPLTTEHDFADGDAQ